jgi:hypothetical protein
MTTATAAVLARLIGREWAAEAAQAMLERHGFHLLPRRYDVPIPDPEECDDAFWNTPTELVGLDMNEASALELLERVVAPLLEEFRASFPLHRTDDGGFFLLNGNYMAVDAHLYYCLIRHLKPRRILEIGGGNSTRLAAAAVLANRDRDKHRSELTCVEPYPAPALRTGFDGLERLIEHKLQDVGLDLFRSLEADDILFIDSSHVLRSGGDVQLEYLEILPRLRPGVHVHVHDISLPRPYPRVYFDQRLYWNEQYLLQAFLAFNGRFEVLWPGNFMMERHPQRMNELFPEIRSMRELHPDSEPTAFWMRVKK